MIIKVFGLPRSCTNITEVLLQFNFKVFILNNFPCWKHEANNYEGRSIHDIDRNIDTDDLRFIVCTKNPYDWLCSFWAYEVTKIKKTFDEFLITNSWHYKNEKPIETFNRLTKHWLTMYSEGNVVQQVKHEDLLEDQVEVMKKIETAFQLTRKREMIGAIPHKIDPGRKKRNNKFKKRICTLTSKQIQTINKQLDEEVVELAGYKLK
jgi:hypothetical protein